MKLNFFSKKNLLDEMQEQTMCKIESRGCYVFAADACVCGREN